MAIFPPFHVAVSTKFDRLTADGRIVTCSIVDGTISPAYVTSKGNDPVKVTIDVNSLVSRSASVALAVPT